MEEKQGILIFPQEVGPYWEDLIARSGLNLVGIHPGGGVGATNDLERFLGFVKTPAFRHFKHRMAELKVDLEFECHAMSWLVPRGLFSDHPGWFRMDEMGKRVADFNLCVSSQEALALLRKRAEELTLALPSSTGRYYYWLDDMPNSSCHCEGCQGLSPSDQALILYNQILQGIRSVDSTARLSYLAYMDTIHAPETVQPDLGIFLEYAPIRRDSTRPIDDPGCLENEQERKHLPGLLGMFGAENAQILEYWMDNSRFCGWKEPLKKLPYYQDVIRQDARYYRRLGFTRLTSFGLWLGEDYAETFGEPPVEAYARTIRQDLPSGSGA
jgi:hypothetical protein